MRSYLISDLLYQEAHTAGIDASDHEGTLDSTHRFKILILSAVQHLRIIVFEIVYELVRVTATR